MLPFVSELSVAYFDRQRRFSAGQLRSIEVVAARIGLVDYVMKVGSDGAGAIAKAFELRVIPIAARVAREHRLSEQSFAPERNETFRIEVLRMERPEAHAIRRDGTGDRASSDRYPAA